MSTLLQGLLILYEGHAWGAFSKHLMNFWFCV